MMWTSGNRPQSMMGGCEPTAHCRAKGQRQPPSAVSMGIGWSFLFLLPKRRDPRRPREKRQAHSVGRFAGDVSLCQSLGSAPPSRRFVGSTCSCRDLCNIEGCPHRNHPARRAPGVKRHSLVGKRRVVDPWTRAGSIWDESTRRRWGLIRTTSSQAIIPIFLKEANVFALTVVLVVSIKPPRQDVVTLIS